MSSLVDVESAASPASCQPPGPGKGPCPQDKVALSAIGVNFHWVSSDIHTFILVQKSETGPSRPSWELFWSKWNKAAGRRRVNLCAKSVSVPKLFHVLARCRRCQDLPRSRSLPSVPSSSTFSRYAPGQAAVEKTPQSTSHRSGWTSVLSEPTLPCTPLRRRISIAPSGNEGSTTDPHVLCSSSLCRRPTGRRCDPLGFLFSGRRTAAPRR